MTGFFVFHPLSLYKVVQGLESLHCFFTYESVEAEGGWRGMCVTGGEKECVCVRLQHEFKVENRSCLFHSVMWNFI